MTLTIISGGIKKLSLVFPFHRWQNGSRMVKYLTDTTQRIAAEAGSEPSWASALLPGLGLSLPPHPWALQRPDPLPEFRLLTDASLPGCEFKVSSQGASPSY